jgi:hypothetical protein
LKTRWLKFIGQVFRKKRGNAENLHRNSRVVVSVCGVGKDQRLRKKISLENERTEFKKTEFT